MAITLESQWWCRKHDGRLITGGGDGFAYFYCVVCDQRRLTLYDNPTPIICVVCSSEKNLCRACGKELEFDNEAQ